MSSIEKRLHMGPWVDRDRPHWFHLDYWLLRAIKQNVVEFTHRYRAELTGQRAMDFGSGDSPYETHFAAINAELLRADLAPDDAKTLRIGSDGRVPVDDESMAAVISTQVLEHVADVQAYLREAKRMLRAGGVLLITTHHAYPYHAHPTDFHRWTLDGLRYECELAGFNVEKADAAVGILAGATWMRTYVLAGALRRVPVLRWLRLPLYFLANLKMGIEDYLTPQWLMKSNPAEIIVFARKPREPVSPAASPSVPSEGAVRSRPDPDQFLHRAI